MNSVLEQEVAIAMRYVTLLEIAVMTLKILGAIKISMALAKKLVIPRVVLGLMKHVLVHQLITVSVIRHVA